MNKILNIFFFMKCLFILAQYDMKSHENSLQRLCKIKAFTLIYIKIILVWLLPN